MARRQDVTARRPSAPAGPRPDVLKARVRSVVEPIVVAADLDLEDLAVVRAGRRYVVRVTVDGDGGVDHDELGEVSRDISTALDEAEETGGELTPDSYTLEVSSPGIDRPLTLPRHWRRNVGRLAKVKAGERGMTARITAVDDVGVTFDGQAGPVPFDQLGPGHIQVEFSHAYGDETEEEDEA
jgi:ribosome maturation factor RimP